MDKIRIGIIGGGRVVERFYLPLVSKNGLCDIRCIVDIDEQRATEHAKKYRIEHALKDYRLVAGKIDAAIVATPHHLHSEISIDLLNSGIHVLVEKPMAVSVEECRLMNEEAKRSNRVLAVGLVERFYHCNYFIKRMIDDKLFGKIYRYDYRQGNKFSWDVASDFQFKRECAGGVLSDIGAHVFDKILWWFGDCEKVEYSDNCQTGVESDCEISITHKNDVSGFIELSRTRDTRNTIIFYTEERAVEVELGFDPKVTIHFRNLDVPFKGSLCRENTHEIRMKDYFGMEITDFLQCITESKVPRGTAEAGMRAVGLLNRCKSVRKPLVYPWFGFNE